MPKRPHTSDSLDTTASSTSSRWSLQKLHSFIGNKQSSQSKKVLPFRLSTDKAEQRQQQQHRHQGGDAFWSSHQDFSKALSLQEQSPVIEISADEHLQHLTGCPGADFTVDREQYADSAETSEARSESPSSGPVSPSWQSPTSTLHMPLFPAAAQTGGSGKSAGEDGQDYTVPEAPFFASTKTSPSLQDFDVLETLGTGTFGRVLLVRRRGADPNDQRSYYAMKVLKKSVIVRLKQVEHINSERSILSNTEHPFLVKMICTFQDSLNCYMLMEFVVGGEIFTHLRRQKRFSADVTRFYIATLVLALSYLHSKRVVYRDMKPENLLIDQDGYLKIADFGFAKELSDTDRTWTLCGTPEYLSPEVIQSRGQTFACDYWCLGILMYEMLCGHPPFYDTTPFGTYEKILAAKINFPSHVDSVSRHLISSLLTVDVSKRLGNLKGGPIDVMNHPWFQGVDWRMLLEKRMPAPIRPHQSHPSDSSNFEKYGHYDISNMPGMHLGAEADQKDLDNDPWKHLFTAF